MWLRILLIASLTTGWLWAGEKKQRKKNRPLPDWSELVNLDTKTGWDGKGRRKGLVAHYYRDKDHWSGAWPEDTAPPASSSRQHTFTQYKYSRIEPLVNHRFIRRGWFSVRWKGILSTAPAGQKDMTAKYTFSIWADDGCRLVLDGKPLIDDWRPCAEDDPGALRSATVTLAPGEHTIQVEYFQGLSLKKKDKDPIKLYWSCQERKIPKQIIPASHFSHARADLEPGTALAGK